MSETLKNRVSRVITGGVHALLNRLEDQAPDVMMEQSIREAESVVDDVRHELGRVAANRHLAQQQLTHLRGQHTTLTSQIDLALTQGCEMLAHAGVARQLDIEAQLPVLDATLAEHTRQETELQGFVAALLAKQREMHDALAEFRKSRVAPPPPSAPVGAADVAHRMAAVTGAFDRLYARQTGLSGTTGGTSLAQGAQLQQLEDLVRNNQIAERLAQLKAGRS